MIGKENLPQTEINKQQFFEFTRQIDKKDVAEYLKSEGLEDVLNSFFDNSIQPINQRLSLFREILDYIDTLYQITKELEFEDGIFSEDKVMNRNNFIVFYIYYLLVSIEIIIVVFTNLMNLSKS